MAAESDFNRLYLEIRQCKICEPALPGGANPVFQAATTSRILVVGQAPGIRVHNTGIPFNDPSGGRLREWMGIDKDIFYDPEKLAIIPMGFCYPGSGKSGDLPPRKECAQTWRSPLLQHLQKIQLTLIMGQHAHVWHLGTARGRNLTETVRNWKMYAPEIIPLPHPSPRNNLWLKKNPWFEREVIPCLQKRIKKILEQG